MSEDVKMEEQNVFRGHSSWVRSFVLFKKLNRAVSASKDGSYIIWDTQNCQILHEFWSEKRESEMLKHVIHWNDTSFLVCGNPVIRCVSVLEPFNHIKEFKRISSSQHRILKLTDDLFAGYSYGGTVAIFSFSKGFLKNLICSKFTVHFVMKRFALSKLHPDCFYVNPDAHNGRPIQLIDYEKDQVVTQFDTTNQCGVFSLETILRKNKTEEVLLVGYSQNNSEDEGIKMFSTKRDSLKPVAVKHTIKKVGTINAIRVLGDRYFFIADNTGIFELWERVVGDEYRLLSKKKLHKEAVYCLDFLSVNRESNKVVMVSSSREPLLKVNLITGLKDLPFGDSRLEGLEREDLKERMEFLVSGVDESSPVTEKVRALGQKGDEEKNSQPVEDEEEGEISEEESGEEYYESDLNPKNYSIEQQDIIQQDSGYQSESEKLQNIILELKTAKEEKELLECQLRKFREDHQNNVKKMKNNMKLEENLHKKIEEIDRRKMDLHKELDYLCEEIRHVEYQIDRKKETINEWKFNRGDLMYDGLLGIGQMEPHLTDTSCNISCLEREIRSLNIERKDIERVELQVLESLLQIFGNLEMEMDLRRREIERKRNEICRIGQRVEKVEREICKLHEKKENLTIKIEELKCEKEVRDEEVCNLQIDSQELKNQIDLKIREGQISGKHQNQRSMILMKKIRKNYEM